VCGPIGSFQKQINYLGGWYSGLLHLDMVVPKFAAPRPVSAELHMPTTRRSGDGLLKPLAPRSGAGRAAQAGPARRPERSSSTASLWPSVWPAHRFSPRFRARTRGLAADGLRRAALDRAPSANLFRHGTPG
jgi:hypothetical protein